MSEFDVNKAKSETKQSNAQLENALNQFKTVVDKKGDTVVQKKEKLSHLMDDKKQAAQDFIENTFEGAESFLDRQTDLLRRTLNSTRSETESFLKEVQSSIDVFTRDVQNSVSRMLGGMEDRRITTFSTLFLAGCLVGSFFGRRYMGRSTSSNIDLLEDQSAGKADINPATSSDMRKIA